MLESDAPGASEVVLMLLMLEGDEEFELLEMAQGGNGVVSGLWRRCGCERRMRRTRRGLWA